MARELCCFIAHIELTDDVTRAEVRKLVAPRRRPINANILMSVSRLVKLERREGTKKLRRRD